MVWRPEVAAAALQEAGIRAEARPRGTVEVPDAYHVHPRIVHKAFVLAGSRHLDFDGWIARQLRSSNPALLRLLAHWGYGPGEVA